MLGNDWKIFWEIKYKIDIQAVIIKTNINKWMNLWSEFHFFKQDPLLNYIFFDILIKW